MAALNPLGPARGQDAAGQGFLTVVSPDLVERAYSAFQDACFNLVLDLVEGVRQRVA